MEPRTAAPSPDPTRLAPWAAICLIVAIGVNVRAIFGATPPLVPLISDDLGISATTASLLTAMPVLAMGLCAPLGHALSRRYGGDTAMLVLFALLGLAELSRPLIDSPVPLVITAGLIGGALGALSTLVPAFIAHHLPRLRGLATGIYSTSMALGVGLAAGTAQPLTEAVGDWRVTLSVWGVTALLLVAALLLARARGARLPAHSGPSVRVRLPLREGRAWFLTAISSVAMVLGFGVIAWLPSLFVEAGIAPARAAAYLVVFQTIQILSILSLAPLTDRIDGRRGVFATVMLTSTAGLLLLVLEPSGMAIPGALLAGFGIGGISTLALVKVHDEARDAADATRLSAMAMLFSFTAGALSPFLVGALQDLSGSLRPGFTVMLGVSVASLLLLVRMTPAHPARHTGRAVPERAVPTPLP